MQRRELMALCFASSSRHLFLVLIRSVALFGALQMCRCCRDRGSRLVPPNPIGATALHRVPDSYPRVSAVLGLSVWSRTESPMSLLNRHLRRGNVFCEQGQRTHCLRVSPRALINITELLAPLQQRAVRQTSRIAGKKLIPHGKKAKRRLRGVQCDAFHEQGLRCRRAAGPPSVLPSYRAVGAATLGCRAA